jgi:hypothetical protein
MATGRKESVEVTLQVLFDVVLDNFLYLFLCPRSPTSLSFWFIISEVNSELGRTERATSQNEDFSLLLYAVTQ